MSKKMKNIPDERVVNLGMSSDAMMPTSPDLDRRLRLRNVAESVSDQIAGSKYYIRNWKWNGAQEDFPNEPVRRTCDKYYPRAKMGPIAVDEPKYEGDFVACERKKKALVKRGHRYLVLTPKMSLDDAIKQLEEVENELDIKSSRAQTAS